jgi:sulfur-carrier protein
MPTVWIPPLLRKLTDDRESIEVAGATLREVIDALESQCPGIKDRLCIDSSVRPGLSVVIDSQINREGMSAPVKPHSEVHFVPAVSGG